MTTLRLLSKENFTDNVWAFRFEPSQSQHWIPGQFMQVELPHSQADAEGTQRWFTVSSAPYENFLQITTRVTNSTFKQALSKLDIGDHINLLASPDGDFVWEDSDRPLVFVAGGIGITPFRSILAQRTHDHAPLDVTLIYANRTDAIAFKDEFDAYASADPRLKVHYVIGKPLTPEVLNELVPKLQDYLVYISGPEPMVEALGDQLKAANLPEAQLKQDFFPNYEINEERKAKAVEHDHGHHSGSTQQHHHEAHGTPDELATCPVMSIPVNKEEAKTHGLTREYKGQTYYLCCNTCAGQWDAAPEKYAGNDGEDHHTHAHHDAGTGDAQPEHTGHDHHAHMMMPGAKTSWWQKFKMSMTMTMGMDHTGLAGREMARLMEIDIRNKFFFSLILSIPIVAYSPVGQKLLGITLPAPIPVTWILFLLTTPVFFYGGWLFLYSSYWSLRQRRLDMSVLIAVGITAAYVFSVFLTLIDSVDSFYEAAVLLITFVLFGHWMEMKSRRGTTDALQALFNLVPPKARRLRDGKEEQVPTGDVQVGDILILKPGDRVPVDGEIVSGQTTVDEALVTGESLPVSKTTGDKLIAGSINQSGSVQFKATKVGGDTALAQIVKMVETAQNSKAPGQRLADKFAGYLVILAVGSGLITFGVWMLAGQPVLFALTLAISAVVIACPDALGLATPTAVAVGTGLGAKHNILIKDAATLEQTSKIQAVVMDKTGTLTEGKPKVTDVATANGFTENQVLELAASAEQNSSHPLAQTIVDAAIVKKIKLSQAITDFNNIAGHGVEATVGSQRVLVGNLRLMKDRKVDMTALQAEANELLDAGKTIMAIAAGSKIAGLIAVQDEPKPTAKLAVERMQELGLEVAMISGDNRKTAEAVARQLGIKRVFAEVLPEDKAMYVKQLQDEGKFVAMVGDGVNDAPALAQADIGIAIGAGTDVAIETAKVVLMKSDPADILRAIRLSKATVRKMKQNLAWASIYNLAAIPAAAGVLYPAFGIALRPEVAALLMSVSSIIVAVNAVLLKQAEKDLVEI